MTTTTIRAATSALELEEAYRLRHRVMVEEKQYFSPSSDGRLVDRFDDLAGAVTLVAIVEGVVVGTARLTPHGPAGAPTDHLFDVARVVPPGARAVHGSQLAVLPRYRGFGGLARALLGMVLESAALHGFTHITAVASPMAEPVLKSIGFVEIAARHFDERSRLEIVPLLLDLRAAERAAA